MARNKGTFTFATNFEPLLEAPLDARMRVSKRSDLITQSIWRDAESASVWLYSGMLVSVVDDPDPVHNGLYFLADKNIYTDPSSWIQLGGPSGTIDASGTSSISFQLNNKGYGVVLKDDNGNLSINTFDGSLATISTSGVYIDGLPASKGYEESLNIYGETIFNVNHNMNTSNHSVTVYDELSNILSYPQVQRGLNTDIISFSSPLQLGESFKVIIIGF